MAEKISDDDFKIMLQFFMDDCANFNILTQSTHLCEPNKTAVEDLVIGKRKVNGESPQPKKYIQTIAATYTDLQFPELFRMTRSTFEKLLTATGNYCDEINQSVFRYVSLSNKLLFTIWLLAHPESFVAASKMFDIPISSGHGIFRAVVNTFSKMMVNYVKWPSIEQQAISAQIFENRSNGFPNVIGAIGLCHISIKQPTGNTVKFLNANKKHSIILQGACDHNGRFIDVFIGTPGCIPDSNVFGHSELFKRLSNPDKPGLSDELHLIGNSMYPLMVNMMTPFTGNQQLSPGIDEYNRNLYSILPVIDQTFERIKRQFARLKHLGISDPKTGNQIIAAACMLHNFIRDCGEFPDEDSTTEEMTKQSTKPKLNTHPPPFAEAEQKRNGIVDIYLNIKSNSIM